MKFLLLTALLSVLVACNRAVDDADPVLFVTQSLVLDPEIVGLGYRVDVARGVQPIRVRSISTENRGILFSFLYYVDCNADIVILLNTSQNCENNSFAQYGNYLVCNVCKSHVHLADFNVAGLDCFPVILKMDIDFQGVPGAVGMARVLGRTFQKYAANFE